jgi:hypothetical protein
LITADGEPVGKYHGAGDRQHVLFRAKSRLVVSS